jgi:hypothetical protein
MANTLEVLEVKKLYWDKTRSAFVESKPRSPVSGRFLKGPIPLPWLASAARLRGKALATGLAVHYAAGLASTHKEIPVTNQLAEIFGVNRYAKRRALEQLAAAGLIRIAQSGKAAARVTIVLKRGRPLVGV